ncbi:hypothetical protein GMMP15_1380006 [Candidatus Magnetomoraceae bacterium gMMP-15]
MLHRLNSQIMVRSIIEQYQLGSSIEETKKAMQEKDKAIKRSGGPPSGAAGGDLSEAYPNSKVAKIQGKNVSTTAPS